MAQAPAQSQRQQAPPGVEFVVAPGEVRVAAKAGSMGWQPLAGVVISAIWTIGWGAGLVHVMGSMQAGTADNTGPAVFVCSVAALAGLYCVGLCIWTVVGHERLVIRSGRLRLTNPWLLGALGGGIALDRVMPFACSGKDCGLQAEDESCCCRWSAVDYKLAFGYGNERISVFPQLSREAKDWLRDRLNECRMQNAERRMTADDGRTTERRELRTEN